jgi:type VI secretion system protein ImpL
MNTADFSLWIVLLAVLLLVILLIAVAFLVLRRAKKQLPQPEKALSLPGDNRVAESFHSALNVLKASVTGASFQYRAPWTLLIGTPKSGKTSVLNYLATAAVPVVEDQRRDGKEIAWGFLNNGVLIDIPGSLLLGPTAGVASDEVSWNHLLRRLNRHRPARPLDGVVLTIAADELLDKNTDVAARGGLIRAKLDQLQSAIGLVLPVYVLITKCDALRGFATYCGEINSDQRKEMFGWSNNHTLDSVFTWVWVDEAMNAIRRVLQKQQFGFFISPAAPESVDDLYLFPSCLDVLRDPLQAFLTQLFVPVSYRDAHYFRGLYFCGLSTAPEGALGGAQLIPSQDTGTSRLPLAFLDHLFDRKVFAEKTLARPVAQRFRFRNRIVAGAQIFTVAFSLLMGIWLTIDWFRLRNEQKQIAPVIASVTTNLKVVQGKDGKMRASYPTQNQDPAKALDQAYSLLQMMAYLHKESFWSPVMPASWHDPIANGIEDTVTAGFSGVVLRAFQIGLEKKYEDLIAASTPTAEPDTPAAGGDTDVPDSMQVVDLQPAHDQSYQALSLYLTRLSLLEKNIALYDDLKQVGSGTIGDVRGLLQYLSGKTMPADSLFANNIYFTRAVAAAGWADLDLKDDRTKAAATADALISAFYADWFEQSSLEPLVEALKDHISSLEQGRSETTMDLRAIGEEIAEIDGVLSGSSIDWLEPPFTRRFYPALRELDDPGLAQVFDQDFRDRAESEGQSAWQDLRQELLSEPTPLSGHLLEAPDNNRIQLASGIRALGANLVYLVNQDFMAGSTSVSPATVAQTPILWNPDMLAEALKLNTSWEKYERDVLPSVPGTLRSVVRGAGQKGLGITIADVIARARTTLAASDDSLTTELKNFDQSLDQLKPLYSTGEKLGPAGTPLTASLNLYPQAVRLLGSMNAQISGNALYSWSKAAPQKWDGSTPLSLGLYMVQSSDDLAAAIEADHARLQTLVDSVDPVAQVVRAGGFSAGTAGHTVDWSKLKDDFKQLGDKKPGNPIATLESFLNHDIDKIVPENRCQAGTPDPRTGDPLMVAMNGLRTDTVRACLTLVQKRYTALAASFNQHLAGRFPFSADPAAQIEADPADVANFFELYTQNATGLADSLGRLGSLDPTLTAKAKDAVAFLGKVALVQPIFATADPASLPALDVTPQFRSNQSREAGGNQIIDWELKIGEQSARYQAPAAPVRWHYGDHVTLMLRYATDSPNVPVATAAANDMQIADRTVTFSFTQNWSLLALLIRHAAASTDFDNPLAPPPNTVRLTFGNAPGSPGTTGQKPSATLVFVTFNLQAPAAKDAPPKEGAPKNTIVLSGFPVSAPQLP